MKRIAFLAALFTAVLVLVVPFVGGGGPGLTPQAAADTMSGRPLLASSPTAVEAVAAVTATSKATKDLDTDWEHIAQKPVPKPKPVVTADGSFSAEAQRSNLEAAGMSCPGDASGSVGSAAGKESSQGVAGTTSDDLASFAHRYNEERIANCLEPVPYDNFYYDSCMEERLFWMAESPSSDPADAWGHMGSTRSDGEPSRGCDGNLAGGMDNSGSDVATKWWESTSHRASLYRPGDSIDGACIAFAMTHGGIDEPYGFTRAAARWTGC